LHAKAGEKERKRRKEGRKGTRRSKEGEKSSQSKSIRIVSGVWRGVNDMREWRERESENGQLTLRLYYINCHEKKES
jgi:hypothetical protein